jgi:hypothetical protein
MHIIQIMEEESNVFDTLFERTGEYTKTSVELLKLKAIDVVSDVASTAASRIVGLVFFLLFFLMGTIGLALWLGDVLGKPWYGFILVASLYGLISLVIHFSAHKWLKKTVSNSIIQQLLK